MLSTAPVELRDVLQILDNEFGIEPPIFGLGSLLFDEEVHVGTVVAFDKEPLFMV